MSKTEQTEPAATPVATRSVPALGERVLVCLAALLYAAIVAASVHWHEPWADEAHSWLLARDSSLVELWTRWMHYEGTPGLWQTLLHGLIRLGLPYRAMNVVSGLLGLAAAYLVLRRAPLPLAVRLALPFTFYLCYQYPVVARSYSLVPVLLFWIAFAAKDGLKRPGLLAVLLSLLAAVSVHGLVLSAFGWLAVHGPLVRRWRGLDVSERKRILVWTGVYAAAVALVILSAWPAQDVTFYRSPNLSATHLWTVVSILSREAFTGYWIPSLAALALSFPFLWRGGALFPFLGSALALCVIASVVYAGVWHEGLLFLAWLFAIWLAANRIRATRGVLAALAIVIAFQCYWTVRSVAYDRTQAYSGSLAAARYLHQAGITSLYGIGFWSDSIQPYFPRNIFANRGDARQPAFWQWTEANHSNEPAILFDSHRAEYLIVGEMARVETERWARLADLAGYRPLKHFDGALFWRTAVVQPEAFDLYRLAGPSASSLSSFVRMSDPAAERQLLSGFYGIESNAWRWTGRRFSVLLGVPPGAGARLELQLIVPETQIRQLGPMTLSASVNGVSLANETITSGGPVRYTRSVPAAALQPGAAAASFEFNRALRPSAADARELAAIAVSVRLRRFAPDPP